MRNLRRRLLNVLPMLGLRVLDVAPGTVVLTRSRKVRIKRIAQGDAVVTSRPQTRSKQIDESATLVTASSPVKVKRLTDRELLLSTDPEARVRSERLTGGALVVTTDKDTRVRVQTVTDDVHVISTGRATRVRLQPLADDVFVLSTGSRLKVRRVGDQAAAVAPDSRQLLELDGSAVVVAGGDARRAVHVGRGMHLVGPSELIGGRERAARDKSLSNWLLVEHLREVLRRYRIDCVVDVGANRGQYACLLRGAGFSGRIVSFEPVPEIFAQLATAAEGDSRWQVHQMALGQESGELEMNVWPGTLSSALPPSQFGAKRYDALRDVHVERVPVRRLEDLLPDLVPDPAAPPRILLKLDTQGFDLEAFRGLGAAGGHVVALQSEVALLTIYEHMPRMPEALAVYEAAGFEITGMYPVSREHRTARVLEYDCVMVRASAL